MVLIITDVFILQHYSNIPVKFASLLSSHKIMKKSGFNFFSNLLVFAANQT